MHKLLLLAGFLALCSLNAVAQAPQITQISPAPNTTAAVSSANITITWNTALASTTANADNIKVWGNQTGLLSSGLTLSTNGTVITIDPVNNFKAGEQIHISVGLGIQSTNGTAISTAQTWSFITAAEGGGLFTPIGTYPASTQAILTTTPGDIDGDSDIDIVFATQDTAYAVINNGNVFDEKDTITYPALVLQTSHLFDRDNDGDLDLLLNNSALYSNNGSGQFTSDGTYNASYGSIHSADLDGDGNLDLVGNERYIFGPSFSASGTIGGMGVFGSYPADIDGDRDQDIVYGGIGALLSMTNNGDGTFGLDQYIGMFGSFSSIYLKIVDMDNDGDLDIVAFESASNPRIFRNDSTAGFTSQVISSIPNGNGGSAFDAADFNGDGAIDIAYAGNDGYIYSLFNNGNLTFSTDTIGCAPMGAASLSTADVNGDNKIDIIVSTYDNEDTKVYLNSPNSGGSLSPSTIVFPTTATGSASTTSASFSFGTLSQDAIFWSNSTSFTISIDNTTFGSTATVTTGAVSPQTLYIRFSPSSTGANVGSINLNRGCLSYQISLSGEGSNSIADGAVLNTLDSGPGSLRYALENATSGTVITFANGVGGIFTITGGPIVIHHPLNINFQNIIGNIIINSGAFPAIQFDCGSVGTVLTGVSVISSHPSGGVISTCPDVQPGKVQDKQEIVN